MASIASIVGGLLLLMLGAMHQFTESWPDSQTCNLVGGILIAVGAVLIALALYVSARRLRN